MVDTMSTHNDKQKELSIGALVAYGGLALPLSIAELPIILYLPAFYAKEVGLSIGMVGLVFLFARIWDGVSDLIIGASSDRTRSRFGQRKPWIAAGAPLLMGAAWFLCNPPDDVGLSYLFIWAILFYTAQTIMKVPYWSWGAELSTNYEERSRVTGFRESSAMIGSLVVASAPLLLLSKDAPVRDVLFLISILIIALIPLTSVPLLAKVRNRDAKIQPEGNFYIGLKKLTKNGPMLRFLFAYSFLQISVGVLNSVAIFLVDTGFGLPGEFFFLFFIEYVVGVLFAIYVVRLASKHGKHVVLSCALVVMVAIFLIGFLLPTGSYAPVVIWICVLGAIFSCIAILPLSILADIVDYDTASFGQAQTGTYVAITNLTMKLGLALGVGIAYGFLEWVGFSPSAHQHTAQDVFKVRLAGLGITSVLLIPAIYILWTFPITKKVQRELQQKIQAHRDSENSSEGRNAKEASKVAAVSLLVDNG